MSEPATIHVNNIASTTSESDLTSFFSFCGKITSLSLTAGADPSAPKSATITFERSSAAKTAVLLDGTPLQNQPLEVSAAHTIDEIAGDHTVTSGAIGPDGEIPQESKPRAVILAEYLSHGYVIADTTLQKAIEVDKQQGITAKFTSLLNSALATIDSKVHATDRAKAADQQYHLVEKAQSAHGTLSQYFEKAAGTGLGQRIRKFYQESGKQILDVHEEAKRLAALRTEKNAQAQTFGKSADGKPFVSGDGQTTCSCGGNEGDCACKEGKCACEGCQKGGVKEASDKAAPTGQLQHAVHDIKETGKDVTGTA